jgi:[pyruvate, water dikinase]-phosphate phosphotransferase / [pyruvate, water dikinase] kinase
MVEGQTSRLKPPTILILSGGVGASAEQVIHTVLSQFPQGNVRVITVPNVRYEQQILENVRRARQEAALVVHTLVDHHLRDRLEAEAMQEGVLTVDLMGDLMAHIQRLTGQAPLEQPGLYRKLNRQYYDRVSAIEYTMAHDDGKDPEGWSQAEILLLGVSRSGKTPLSLYLSVLGWRVANLPLVSGLQLPEALDHFDRQRMCGLKIDAGQLLLHRQQRQRSLGAPGVTSYTDPARVQEELAYALEMYRRLGCTVIDVTDRPIETSADEIIRLMTKRFG